MLKTTPHIYASILAIALGTLDACTSFTVVPHDGGASDTDGTGGLVGSGGRAGAGGVIGMGGTGLTDAAVDQSADTAPDGPSNGGAGGNVGGGGGAGDGGTGGVCVPGTPRCSPANGTPQLCDTNGAWQDKTACGPGFIA
jgi:hypothetical protein